MVTEVLSAKSILEENNIIFVEDGFFGDGGKGKLTAKLAKAMAENKDYAFVAVANEDGSFDFDAPEDEEQSIHGYVVRMNGGPNGGHSLQMEGKEKFTSHVLPAGIIEANVKSVIGAGCAVDPTKLLAEMNEAKDKGYFNGPLAIDDKAEVIFSTYCEVDGARNGMKSTGSGISECYGHKGMRDGIKVRDLLDGEILAKKLDKLLPFLYNEYRTVLENEFADLMGASGSTVMNRVHAMRLDKSTKEWVKDALDERAEDKSASEVAITCLLEDFISRHNGGTVFNELNGAGEQLRRYISPTINEELRCAIGAGMPVVVEASQSVLLDVDSGIENGTSSSIHPGAFFTTQNIPLEYAKDATVISIFKTHGSSVGDRAYVGETGDRSRALRKKELLKKLGFAPDATRAEYEGKAVEMMRSEDQQEKGDGFRLFYSEYGETTGRPRGVGPLDLNGIRTTVQQVGENICLNVMDGLEKLKYIEVITHYTDADGKVYGTIPKIHDEKMAELVPHIAKIKPWENKTSRNYHEWDDGAKAFLNYVERETGARIVCCGVGTGNDDVVFYNPTAEEKQLRAEFVK